MIKLDKQVEIEVVDEEICNGCEHLKFKQVSEKKKDAYGIDIVEKKIQCANKELCEYLIERISKEKFLHG